MGIRYGNPTISPFNSFVNLTPKEQHAMRKFIRGQSRAGTNNWAKLKSFQFYCMDSSYNSLVDWKGFAQPRNPYALDWVSTEGFKFWSRGDVSTYLDPGILQSDLVDGDGFTCAYVLENRDVSTGHLFGALNTPTICTTHISQNPASGNIGWAQQTNNLRSYAADLGRLTNNTLYTVNHLITSDGGGANPAIDMELYFNGQYQGGSSSVTQRVLGDVSILVGTKNWDGVPGNQLDADIMSFAIGTNDGFDHEAFYNGLEELRKDMRKVWPTSIQGCRIWLDSNVGLSELWPDRSEDLELFTTGYDSDFSAGLDGWSPFEQTGSAPESAVGIDDAMRIDCSAGTGQKWITKGTGLSFYSNMIQYAFDCYINASTNNIINVRLYGGANEIFFGEVDVSTGWQHAEGYDIPSDTLSVSRYNNIRFRLNPLTFTGDDTDSFYVKNVKYYFVKGTHFYTRTNWPTLDGVWYTFNGTDEYLKTNIKNYDFAADASGEWFGVIKTPSTDTSVYISTFEASTNYHSIGISLDSGSMYFTVTSVIGASTNMVRSNTALATDTDYLLNLSSDSTGYRMAINGVEQSLTTMIGTNNGNWVTDISAGLMDNIQKARIIAIGEVYSPLQQSSEVYYSAELSNRDRNLVTNFLNEKYSAF